MKLFKLAAAGLATLCLVAAVPGAASAVPIGGTGVGGNPICVPGNLTGCVLITGHVTAVCSMTTNSASISLGELAGSDAKLDTTRVDNKTAALAGFCNGATSKMSVLANPLTGPSTSVSGFTNVVNFIATATLRATPAVFATDDSAVVGAGTATPVGVFSDTIDVTLSGSNSANAMLVAGNYNGSVVVTLTPGS